jgi:ankyrin repeat protein
MESGTCTRKPFTITFFYLVVHQSEGRRKIAMGSPVELKVVAFVLHHQPYIEAPLEVGSAISSFLGPSRNLSLSGACKLGSIALLDWIWGARCSSVAETTSAWSLANFLRSDRHYCKWQFAKATIVVVGCGNLAMLKWLFEHFTGCAVPVEAAEEAAGNGHLDVLEFLLEHDAAFVQEHVVNAAGGRTELQRGVQVTSWEARSVVKAAANGHENVAQWLFEVLPHQWDDQELGNIVRAALKAGSVGFAQKLLPSTRRLVDYVADCHVDVIEMMLERGLLEPRQACAVAAMPTLAAEGRLDLILRITEAKPQLPVDSEAWLDCWRSAMVEATTRGRLATLQWLVNHPTGQELLSQTEARSLDLTCLAAAEGHVEIMAYLYSEGVQDDLEFALMKATQNGRLNAVQWLLRHMMQHSRFADVNLMDEAAKYGHLHVLQFLHDLKSSENEFVGSGAFIVRAILAKGSPRALDFAAERGHLAVVQWLHTHRSEGCTTDAMDFAAKQGHLDVLQWLHHTRIEGCTAQAMDLAAEKGHLEIVKWLHANRSEGCTFAAIEKAIDYGHLQVACWLRKCFPEHVPSMVGKAIPSENFFDAILFLHVHYPHVFSIWFCHKIKHSLRGVPTRTRDRLLLTEWLDANYVDPN